MHKAHGFACLQNVIGEQATISFDYEPMRDMLLNWKRARVRKHEKITRENIAEISS